MESWQESIGWREGSGIGKWHWDRNQTQAAVNAVTLNADALTTRLSRLFLTSWFYQRLLVQLNELYFSFDLSDFSLNNPDMDLSYMTLQIRAFKTTKRKNRLKNAKKKIVFIFVIYGFQKHVCLFNKSSNLKTIFVMWYNQVIQRYFFFFLHIFSFYPHYMMWMYF